jgi:hypothetical protein
MDVLIVVLLLLAFGGVGPWWGYSHSWGWGPGGIVGVILLILLIRAAVGGRL